MEEDWEEEEEEEEAGEAEVRDCLGEFGMTATSRAHHHTLYFTFHGPNWEAATAPRMR